MIPTVFDDQIFDFKVFSEYPKCYSSWCDRSGAGCLLTALWKGFLGDDLQKGECGGLLYKHNDLILNEWGLLLETDNLAIELGLSSYEFDTTTIISNFDAEEDIIAVSMLMRLIGALPKSQVKNMSSSKDNVVYTPKGAVHV